MPRSAWKLPETPLHARRSAERYFAGVAQAEALARLQFLVHNHRRLGLLLGARGSGKSLLLDVFAQQLRDSRRQVLVINVNGMALDEFLWNVAAGFALNPPAHAGSRELWRDVEDLLVANRYQRIDTVLLLDDMEEAETEILTAVSRLAQLDNRNDSPFTMIMAAETGRRNLLGERLLDMSDLRVEIEPWSTSEAQQFLLWSLAEGGYSQAFMTTRAIERIVTQAQGIPRRIRHLAQLAVIAAEGQDLAQIDEHFVGTVQAELA